MLCYFASAISYNRKGFIITANSDLPYNEATHNQIGIVKNAKEPILKWKGQYSRPPCTNYFRSGAFDIANSTYFLQTCLNEEVNRTTLPFYLVFPETADQFCKYQSCLCLSRFFFPFLGKKKKVLFSFAFSFRPLFVQIFPAKI
jgi:hypothetical protein